MNIVDSQIVSSLLVKKGYKQTEEHKFNNRKSQHRKSVECIEAGVKYPSLAEAER